MAEVTELEPTPDEIEAALAYLGEENWRPPATMGDLMRLYGRVALLLRALAPFLDEADLVDPEWPDDAIMVARAADLRRARRIVRGEE